MLPLVLVLIAAQSAFAVPAIVSLTQNSINNVAPPRDLGSLVNSFLTEGSFELIDSGELSTYDLVAKTIVDDLANSPDALSQAVAVGQTINLLAEVAVGNSGDACEYAALINAAASNNPAAIAGALPGYVNRLNSNIDLITSLALNPNALRNVNGRRSGCKNGGRSYNFETAWDRVLNLANPYQIGLLNEQYCTARRLYNSSQVRNNNAGAALSASAVPPATEISQAALGPLANFLRVVAKGGNPSAAAANAKKAVTQAAGYIAV